MGISSFALFALVLVGANALDKLITQDNRTNQQRALAKKVKRALTSETLSNVLSINLHGGKDHSLMPKHHDDGKPYSLFGGDMLVTYDQIARRFGHELADSLQKSGFRYVPSAGDIPIDATFEIEADDNRAVEVDSMWPEAYRYNGRIHIPYFIEGYGDPQADAIIKQGLDELSEETGVLKFISSVEFEKFNSIGANIPDHFLKFVPSSGCSSFIGHFTGDAGCSCSPPCSSCQRVNMLYDPDGPSCFRSGLTGIIKHEVMHALSFFHEQSRTDRDDFVTINFENIEPGFENNFNMAIDSESLGTPYDYGSVMHYSRDAFSTNGESTLDVIPPVPDPFNEFDYVGQRRGVSNIDVKQLQLLYQCSSGPRDLSIAEATGNECTPECPCWENSFHPCEGDDECQGGLVCVPNSEDIQLRVEPYCIDRFSFCPSLVAECFESIDYSVDRFRYFCPETCKVPGCGVDPGKTRPANICQNPVVTAFPSATPTSSASPTSPTPSPSARPSTSSAPTVLCSSVANDNVANAESIAVDSSAVFDLTCATAEPNEPAGENWFDDPSVENSLWYTFVAPASGCVEIETVLSPNGESVDTQLALYDVANPSNFSTFEEIASDDDGGTSFLYASFLSTPSILIPGQTYYIQVDGWYGEPGISQLDVRDYCLSERPSSSPTMSASPSSSPTVSSAPSSSPTLPLRPTNDNIANRSRLSLDGVPVPFILKHATKEIGEPVGSSWNDGPRLDNSIWFLFEAPSNGCVEIETIGPAGSADTQIALYDAADPTDFTSFVEIASDDDSGTSYQYASYVEVSSLTPGNEYYLQVDGWFGDQRSASIQVTPCPYPSAAPSAASTSCPTGEAYIPANYWAPPLDKPGFTCENVRLKIPDHGEFSCLPVGEGICRDNGGNFGTWRFGVEEVERPRCNLSGKCPDPNTMLPTNTFPVLIDPATTRYPLTGTSYTDSVTGEVCRNGYGEAIQGCNYAGTTHICISENIESDPNRYSNERPYMFFYNEKTHQYLYQLVCDGIGEEGKLPELKMVNNEEYADSTYINYPVDMVKFKKGATPNKNDSNELWKMFVDWNGFADPATRRRGQLASFIQVAHPKFCREYVSRTEKACWKEDCDDVETPESYERFNCANI